jgi:hypothetical protein
MIRLNSLPTLVENYHRATGLRRSDIRKAISMSITSKGRIDEVMLDRLLKKLSKH